MEPIRVAQIMGYMNGGGVESVVMNYYRHIDRDKVQFDFIVCEGSKYVPHDEIESLGGRIFLVPPYQHAFEYAHALKMLFQKHRWHVVHSHMNSLSVLSLKAAKDAGVPVRIAHSHSTSGRGEPLKNMAKAALRAIANVYPTERLACSDIAGRWLFGRKSYTVIPNAIDLSKFSFNDSLRARLRRKYSVRDDQIVYAIVGRLCKQKNQEYALKIFEKVLSAHPDAMLMLVGAGPMEADCRQLVDRLRISKNVIFTGQVDDVSPYYSMADMLVMPSRYEGFGMVAVEAQHAGLSCLVSDAIPGEALLTNGCVRRSLSDEAAWVTGMADACVGRRVAFDDQAFVKYDIRYAVLQLEERYLLLAKS